MPGVKGQASGGHNRKTAAQHKSDGTFQNARHGGKKPLDVKHQRPEMPKTLNKDAKKLWGLVCETLPAEAMTKLHSHSLQVFVETFQLYQKIQPLFLDDPTDASNRQAWQSCVTQLEKLGRQFGWTPQTLAALQVTASDEENADAFDQWVKGKRNAS